MIEAAVIGPTKLAVPFTSKRYDGLLLLIPINQLFLILILSTNADVEFGVFGFAVENVKCAEYKLWSSSIAYIWKFVGDITLPPDVLKLITQLDGFDPLRLLIEGVINATDLEIGKNSIAKLATADETELNNFDKEMSVSYLLCIIYNI